MPLTKLDVPQNNTYITKVDQYRVLALHGCRVLISVDDGRWHLSVSRQDRDPTPEEIDHIRRDLIPSNANLTKLLKARTKLNKHCFHLWEVDR